MQPPPSMPPDRDLGDEGSPVLIGGFRVVRRLASGGTADIFLARAAGPHGFERVVVLKVLLQRFRHDPAFERMFAREASAYARLSHPAIVKLYDFFSSDGQLVMVLEYVDGLPLNKLRAMLSITGDKLDDRASFFIASRVFSALAAAHAAKDPETAEFAPVIHRDINPSNVLVPWDGHVKLADFGIAKVAGMQGDTKTGFIKGTYGYMAPEQVRGESVTGRADVYAATLLLWELLTRRKAIQRGALPEVEVLKAMARPQFPSLDALRPELDATVRDAVRRGLEPVADRRAVSAEEMAAVLRAAVHGADDGRSLLLESLARVRPPPTADQDITLARLQVNAQEVATTRHVVSEAAAKVWEAPTKPDTPRPPATQAERVPAGARPGTPPHVPVTPLAPASGTGLLSSKPPRPPGDSARPAVRPGSAPGNLETKPPPKTLRFGAPALGESPLEPTLTSPRPPLVSGSSPAPPVAAAQAQRGSSSPPRPAGGSTPRPPVSRPVSPAVSRPLSPAISPPASHPRDLAFGSPASPRPPRVEGPPSESTMLSEAPVVPDSGWDSVKLPSPRGGPPPPPSPLHAPMTGVAFAPPALAYPTPGPPVPSPPSALARSSAPPQPSAGPRAGSAGPLSVETPFQATLISPAGSPGRLGSGNASYPDISVNPAPAPGDPSAPPPPDQPQVHPGVTLAGTSAPPPAVPAYPPPTPAPAAIALAPVARTGTGLAPPFEPSLRPERAPAANTGSQVTVTSGSVAGPPPIVALQSATSRGGGFPWRVVLLVVALGGGGAIGYFGFLWRPSSLGPKLAPTTIPAVVPDQPGGEPRSSARPTPPSSPGPSAAALASAQAPSAPEATGSSTGSAVDPGRAPPSSSGPLQASPATSATAMTAATAPAKDAAAVTFAPPTPSAGPTPLPPSAPPSAAGGADTGSLVVAGGAGHRVYVDGRVVGQSPGTFQVRCGARAVHVGSGQEAKSVDVPCGGSRDFKP